MVFGFVVGIGYWRLLFWFDVYYACVVLSWSFGLLFGFWFCFFCGYYSIAVFVLVGCLYFTCLVAACV